MDEAGEAAVGGPQHGGAGGRAEGVAAVVTLAAIPMEKPESSVDTAMISLIRALTWSILTEAMPMPE